MSFVIAVDGPAAAGKGTLARRLAAALNLAHLDTGALYRAVGVTVLRAGGDPADPVAAEAAAGALKPDDGLLNDPELRSDAAARAASKVAAIPGVRAALLEFQRTFAKHPPGDAFGAVLDGRDVGTVVCPDAAIKFFVTASVEARAKRRTLELLDRGMAVNPDDVLTEMRERDERDSKRAAAPLRPAEDAVVVDTSELDAEAAFAVVMERVRAARGQQSAP